MDRLHDSYIHTEGEITSINRYLFLVFIVFLLIGIAYLISIGLSIRTASLYIFSILPKMDFNSLLYFLAGMVFLSILYILIRSRTVQHIIPVSRIPTHKKFWTSKKIDVADVTKDGLIASSQDWFPKNTDMSLGVELMMLDSRQIDDNKAYRCIFYKGTDDIAQEQPDGLPSVMSPGVFLDKMTNDLIIFVDTDPNVTFGKGYRESIRVNDIPLNIPFNLHLILTDKVLEVYINCRLAGTKLLHGSPRLVPNNWYAKAGFSPAQSIVQNLTLYDGALNTTDVLSMCKTTKMA
jgi:hypothetical protein